MDFLAPAGAGIVGSIMGGAVAGPPGAYMGAAAGLVANETRKKFDKTFEREFDLTEEEREFLRQEREQSAQEQAFLDEMRSARPEGMSAYPAASSSGPSPADWRSTSMMGLELASSGINETAALVFAHELYKHPDMRGYMDHLIGSRIPSMRDIQDLYRDLEGSPMREYLLSVQDKVVKRYGEDYMLIEGSAPVVTIVPRFTRGASGSSGGVFRPRVVG